MKKNLEIEKRILLKRMPTVNFNEIQRINQYYCPNGRFREVLSNGKVKYIKTIKSTISIGVNHEVNSEISKEIFLKEKKKATKFLSKMRYIKNVGKYKWEVDVFTELNLIIAEIEVKTKKELHTVKIPPFIGKQMIMDITGIKQFSNYNLADKI